MPCEALPGSGSLTPSQAHQPAEPANRPDQHAVFARAVEAGNVWVSGLGVGTGSAQVQVIDADWRGGPELARQLFYQRLEVGYTVRHARLVRRSPGGQR